jgi:origin recognition complex subunit 1
MCSGCVKTEIYYTLESNETILPEVVLSRAIVIGKGSIHKSKLSLIQKRKGKQNNPAHCSNDESGREDKNGEDEDEDAEERFSCNLAVDSYRGLFYDFHWEAHRKSVLSLTASPSGTAEDDIEEDASWGCGISWNVAIQGPRKGGGGTKRKLDEDDESDIDSKDEYQDSNDGQEDEDEDMIDGDEDEDDHGGEDEPMDENVVMEPRTPSKKRLRRDQTGTSSSRKYSTTTPRKQPTITKPLAQPTPHSKKAVAARRKQFGGQSSPSKKKQKFTIRPRVFPLTDWSLLQLNSGPKDPWLRAMHMLHVGNRPDSLPCRDAEFENVLRCVGELLEDGSGGCVCKFHPSLLPG